jgi:putative lipoic acid-binding regulatory protein
MKRHDPDELIDFPCNYEFKAFAFADDDEYFIKAVRAAVTTVMPVPRDAMRTRYSSGGRYQCVTILVHLQNSQQLKSIYSALRSVDGLKYLL